MDVSATSSPSFRLSAPAYFACVLLATAIGVFAAMLYSPVFAYSVRSVLGIENEPQASQDSFYVARVAPLFEEHCAGCHGESRQKADLRLDSFAAAMRGGKHGPVIVSGDTQSSELVVRLRLPPEDDKAMPPPGRSPLSPDETTVIELWIHAGASGSLPVTAIKDAPPPAMKVEFPNVDATQVAQLRAPLADAVRDVQSRIPGVLSYESRTSADLLVSAYLMGEAFGDAEVKALTPLCDRIVQADFSRTSITDASATFFAACSRLESLRLADTGIGESTLEVLLSSSSLRSLSVVDTSLPAASLDALVEKGVAVYTDHGDATRADGS